MESSCVGKQTPKTQSEAKRWLNKIASTAFPTQMFSVNDYLYWAYKVCFLIVIYFGFFLVNIFEHVFFSIIGPNIMKFKILACFFKGFYSHLCQAFCYHDFFFPLIFFISENFAPCVVSCKFNYHCSAFSLLGSP